MAEEKKEASVSQETVKTEGQKSTGKEKEEEEKKDWRVEEVNSLKRKFRRWRGVALSVLSIDLAIILFNWLSPQNLPVPPRVLYWCFIVPLMGWYISHVWKIVKAWERGVVFRLGKCLEKVREPGWTFVWWPFEKIRFVRMWEQRLDPPSQPVITTDNIEIQVNPIIFYLVTDPRRFLIGTEDTPGMLVSLAQAAIRDAAGNKSFDEVRGEREVISRDITDILNKAATGFSEEEKKPSSDKETTPSPEKEKKSKDESPGSEAEQEKGWGVKVTRVKLQEVRPPDELLKAIEKVFVATKGKEAKFEEAEGEKGALIRIADGTKHKLIAEAKGNAKDLELKVKALGPEGAKQLTAILVAGLVKQGDKFFIDPQAAGLPFLKEIFTNITKPASEPK